MKPNQQRNYTLKTKIFFTLFLAMSILLASCNINSAPPPDSGDIATSAALTVQAVLTPLASPTAGSDPGPVAQPDTIVPPGELCEENIQIISWTRGGVNYDVKEVEKGLDPNQAFTMEWELQNTGTCTWDNNYSMRYRDGEQIAFAESMPVIPLGNTVAPGATFKVSVQMAAPGKDGKYESTYSFTNGSGEFITNFGVITNVGSNSNGPSSTGSLAAPGKLAYLYDCTSGNVVIELNWVDKSNNEDGFRVYREGEKIADVSANTTTYKDIAPAPGEWSYTVSAFNKSGESPAKVVADTKNCQ